MAIVIVMLPNYFFYANRNCQFSHLSENRLKDKLEIFISTLVVVYFGKNKTAL